MRTTRLLASALAAAALPLAACHDHDHHNAAPPSRVGFPAFPTLVTNPAPGAFPADIAGTTSIAAADVDGDQALDVLLGNAGPDALYRAEGGRFVRVPDAAFPAFPADTSAVAFVDINGDGELDAVSGQGPSPLRVLLGDGKGGFRQDSVTGPTHVLAILPVDVDGDDDEDLVFARGASQRNQLWINNGDGTWTDVPAQLPPDTETTHAVAAADVDGDDDLDLVFGNAGEDRLYLNDGKGSFVASTTALRSSATRAIAAGDLDGDKDVDLVLVGSGGSTVLLGDGAGAFADRTSVWLPDDSEADSRAAALVDLDGDDDLDLVELRFGSPSRISTNDGAKLALATDSGLRALPDRASALLARDVDGDADIDLVVGVDGGATLLYRNDGSGKFTEASRSSALGISDPAMLAADLDGDGDVDILAPGEGLALFSTGSAGFEARPSATASDVQASLAADVDADGDVDVVLARNGRNALWINDGKGLVRDEAASRRRAGVANSQSALAFDADGDGDLDLFFGNLASGARLLQNDGKGVFSDASASVGSVQSITSAVAGDLDDDGDLDLVTGSSTAPTRVLRNDGEGVFTIEAPVSNARTRGLALGDVDGDGDPDVVSAGVDGQVHRLLRNTDGELSLDALPSSDDIATGGAKLVDIEGDGDLDAVFPGNTTRVFLNDGTGNFADASTAFFPAPGLVSSDIVVTDVDADQDADFILIDPRNGARVLYNLQNHLASSGDAFRGQSYEWTIYSKAGLAEQTQFAIPYMRFGPRQTPFQVPPFGTWFLGPNPFVVLDAQTIPAPAGLRTLRFNVPDDPRLAGLQISDQALLLPELSDQSSWRLTGPVFDTIR